MDDATAQALARGERVIELLKQPQTEMLSLSQQTALLLCFVNGDLTKIPVQQVSKFKTALLAELARSRSRTLASIDETHALSPEVRTALSAAISKFVSEYCE